MQPAHQRSRLNRSIISRRQLKVISAGVTAAVLNTLAGNHGFENTARGGTVVNLNTSQVYVGPGSTTPNPGATANGVGITGNTSNWSFSNSSSSAVWSDGLLDNPGSAAAYLNSSSVSTSPSANDYFVTGASGALKSLNSTYNAANSTNTFYGNSLTLSYGQLNLNVAYNNLNLTAAQPDNFSIPNLSLSNSNLIFNGYFAGTTGVLTQPVAFSGNNIIQSQNTQYYENQTFNGITGSGTLLFNYSTGSASTSLGYTGTTTINGTNNYTGTITLGSTIAATTTFLLNSSMGAVTSYNIGPNWTFNNTAAAAINAATTYNVGTGAILLANGPTGYAGVPAWIASGQILTTSTGALAITANDSSTINMSSYPSLYLGTGGNYTYSGSLTPNAASGYLLGNAGSISTSVLTVSTNLSGPYKLTTGGSVVLSGTNSYTGLTTILPGTVSVTGDQSNLTGGWAINPTNAGTTTTTANFASGSIIAVPSGSGIQVGALIGSGSTAAQTLNVLGTVNNAGSLAIGRASNLNVNSGGVFNQSGTSASINGEGGYGAILTVNAGGIFNYTGASPFQVNQAYNSSGGATLSINGGTFITGQGFLDTTLASGTTTGTGLLNLSGGSVVLTNNIPQLFTGSGAAFAISLSPAGGYFNTSGYSAGISSSITGGGGFTLLGGGLMTLTGTTTFTGVTSVDLGTLNLSSTLALQKSNVGTTGTVFDQSVGSHAFTFGGLVGNYALTLADNAGSPNPVALSLGASNLPATFSGSVTGPGSLTKLGTSTQILNGSNSYTGSTSVTAGTLEFATENSLYANNAGSWTTSNITVSSGATLAFGAGSSGQFTSSDLATLVTNLITDGTVGFKTGSLLGLDVSAPVTISANIPGAVGITKLGTSTLTLSGANTYTGKTTISGGSIVVTGSLAATPVTFANSGGFAWTAPSAGVTQSLGALTLTSGEATVTSTYGSSGNAALSFASISARPSGVVANFVVSGGSNGTTNQIDLVGKAAGFVDQGTFFGGADYAWMDGAGTFVRAINYGTDAGSVTTAGGTTLGSTAHQQVTGAVTAQATATFTTLKDSGANAITLASTAAVTTNGILKTGGNAATISGGVGINASSGAELVIRTNASGDVLTISTPIVSNGTNNLTKSGAGTLIFNGGSANTYTGVTTVDAGTLQNLDAATANSFQKSSGIVVNSGATLYSFRTNGGGLITETVVNPTTTLNDGAIFRTASSVGSLAFVFTNNFVINGNVTFNESNGSYVNSISSSGALSGSGNINFVSAGGTLGTGGHTLTLTGANSTYSGNWSVSSTTPLNQSPSNLVAGATAALGGGYVTLNANSILSATVPGGLNGLAGINVNNANAILSAPAGMYSPATVLTVNAGTVNIGSASSLGVATMGSLTQTGGTINLYPGSTASDVLNLAGNYNYTGGAIAVSFGGIPSASTYTLVNYAGTLSGTPTVNFTQPANSRETYALSYGTGSNSSITLNLSGAAASLLWQGSDATNPNNWDVVTTQNFKNLATSALDYFYNYDAVTFDDTAASFNPTIASGTTLTPGAVVFNNSTSTYTLSGGGAIGGPTSLVKNGAGTTIISTANTYTGGTVINGGILSISAPSALGSVPASATTVLTLSGGGLQTTGSVTFTATQNISVGASGGSLDLDGNGITVNSVISGTGPLAINNTGNGSGGTLTLTNINTDTGALTLNNASTVNLAYTTATPATSTEAFSAINVTAGSTLNTVGTHTFGYSTSTRPLLNISGGTVNNSAGKDNYLGQIIMTAGNITGSADYRLQVTTGYTTASVITLPSSTASVISVTQLQLYSTANFNVSTGTVPGGVDLAISSNITTASGTSGLIKTGSGVASLTGNNTYTGGTNVSAGQLIFASSTAFPSLTALSVGSSGLATAANVSTGTTGSSKNNLFLSSLTLAGATDAWTGKLDIGNNDLIVRNGSVGTLTNQVKQGYNGGAYGTAGVFSTFAQADSTHLTTLGVIQNSVDGTTIGSTLYGNVDGLGTNSTDVLAKYAYFGDANLDGLVDGSDYSRIDAAYVANQGSPGSVTGWFNGDFNYDGLINGSDYTLMDNAYNTQGAAIAAAIASPTALIGGSGTSAVPEPTTIGLLGLGAIGLLGRRRRRN